MTTHLHLPLLAVLLAFWGCSPSDDPVAPEADSALPVQLHDFGRRGESVEFSTICRYEVLEMAPVMTLLDFTIEHGGFTCHSRGRGILFVPERDGRCANSEQLTLSNRQILSVEHASREFYSCMAMIQPGSTSETSVVTFQSSVTTTEFDHDFGDFLFDLMALSNHDALPISHLSSMNNVVCMETEQPEVVIERVVASDIADASVYVSRIHQGTCREIGSRLIGQRWVEIIRQ